MYRYGSGVIIDYSTAVEWFRKAADQGEPLGQDNLANMYALGLGVDKDLATALKWYRQAAEGGVASAQYNVATILAKGEGGRHEVVEAYAWYELLFRRVGHQDRQGRITRARDVLARRMSLEEIERGRVLAGELDARVNPPVKVQ